MPAQASSINYGNFSGKLQPFLARILYSQRVIRDPGSIIPIRPFHLLTHHTTCIHLRTSNAALEINI